MATWTFEWTVHPDTVEDWCRAVLGLELGKGVTAREGRALRLETDREYTARLAEMPPGGRPPKLVFTNRVAWLTQTREIHGDGGETLAFQEIAERIASQPWDTARHNCVLAAYTTLHGPRRLLVSLRDSVEWGWGELGPQIVEQCGDGFVVPWMHPLYGTGPDQEVVERVNRVLAMEALATATWPDQRLAGS